MTMEWDIEKVGERWEREGHEARRADVGVALNTRKVSLRVLFLHGKEIAMSRLCACVFVVVLGCSVASASDDPQGDVARMSQDLQSLPAVDQRNLASGFVEILR